MTREGHAYLDPVPEEPGPSLRSKLLKTLAALAVIAAVLVVKNLFYDNPAKAVQAGDCVASASKPTVTDCASPEARFTVAGRIDQAGQTTTCEAFFPPAAYRVYRSTGTTGDLVLCMLPKG